MAKKETNKPAVIKSTKPKKALKKQVGAKPTPKMTISKKRSTPKKEDVEIKFSRFSSFFSEFKENVSEGAKALANISTDIFEEVKEKAEDLYGKGAEKFEQASGVVENYVDRYKGEKEIKQLTKEKEELNGILGSIIYHEFKKNGSVSKRFLTTKKSSELFSSIESIDKRILKLGKELDNQ